MTAIDNATILHWHRYRMREFGPGTLKALGWRGPESQTARFDVLLKVGDFEGCSVLDVGCGFGDLRGLLHRRGIRCEYTGIDHMPEFLSEASARYGALPSTRFLLGNFARDTLPKADYVLASGAFGYRSSESDFHLRMIRKLAGTANIALAFNMLDATTFGRHELLIGHDRLQIIAQCRTLSPNVQVIDRYLEDDFTVFLYSIPEISVGPRNGRRNAKGRSSTGPISLES
jgi:SAM-dependent methyltransferase